MTSAPDAEARLAGLGIAVVLLDHQGTIAGLNPAAEELLGRSEARLLGTPLAAHAVISDDTLIEHLRRANGPLSARSVDVVISGVTRLCDVTVADLDDGWRVLTLMPVSDMAPPVSDTPSTMPSILAHEVKNPLAAIRGAAQLLARAVPGEQSELTSLITREVDRIAELLDRMQRLGTRQRADIAPFNLHAAIRNALAAIRVGDVAQGVQFRERFDPSLPDVAGNRAALEQVLINLIANACEAAAHEPAPEVVIRTGISAGAAFSHSLPDGMRRLPVEVTIADNGPGFPDDLAERIFEPFVTGKPQGQGLGLPLARKLVQDMGGHLTCQRDTARGLTLFRILLPMET